MKFNSDIIYAILFVAIMGGFISFVAINSRMDPGDITSIHNNMEDERDAYLPTFQAMAFDLKVLDKEMKYMKYPIPDERYLLTVDQLAPITLADGQPPTGIFYDFDSDPNTYIVSIPGGRAIEKGDQLSKQAGQAYFIVKHPDDSSVDTLDLHWRLFYPDSLRNPN